MAIPAIVDPANSKSHVVVAANHHTWNDLVSIAERVRGVKISKEYVGLQDILARIGKAEDPMVKFGLGVLTQYQKDIPRHDYSKSAYNMQHPEHYQGMKFTSIEEFIKSAAQK